MFAEVAEEVAVKEAAAVAVDVAVVAAAAACGVGHGIYRKKCPILSIRLCHSGCHTSTGLSLWIFKFKTRV